MQQMTGAAVMTPLITSAGEDTSAAVMTVTEGQTNYVAGAFQVSGTLTTVVVYFECTINGSDWVELECVDVGDSGSVVTQTTGAGVFRFNAIGLYKVRARLDWTAGSVTIYGTLIA